MHLGLFGLRGEGIRTDLFKIWKQYDIYIWLMNRKNFKDYFKVQHHWNDHETRKRMPAAHFVPHMHSRLWFLKPGLVNKSRNYYTNHSVFNRAIELINRKLFYTKLRSNCRLCTLFHSVFESLAEFSVQFGAAKKKISSFWKEMFLILYKYQSITHQIIVVLNSLPCVALWNCISH